jgi:hypothetical protein
VDSDSLGAAISAACKLVADGAIVWQLKGSDGFTMEGTDIERMRRQEFEVYHLTQVGA